MGFFCFSGVKHGENGRKAFLRSAFLVVHSLLLFALVGCYPDRWTSKYDDYVGETNVEGDNSVLEESGRDEESEIARMEILQKLADEEGQAYRINSGDQIEVRVYGHEDLGVTTKVSPDGTIGMVFLGQVEIAGRTISEARDTIESGLAPYVRHPVVGVTVMEVSSETITISGACAKPGLYNISSTTRLVDAYAMAGGSAERLFNGVDVDVADLTHSTLVRDGVVLPIDFRAAIEGGDRLNNVKLRKGDYIFIAQRMESSVTICGEVNRPHRRLFDAKLGLIEALTTAGWMLDSHWSHVIVIRGGLANPKMYKVDIDGILAGKCKNFPLEANDIIYVPKDNMAEYNVFVRKILPTAQLVNLIFSRVTAYTSSNSSHK